MRVRCPGFTLVELLVSMGITVLLATLMLTVVTNAGDFWSRASGRLSVEASARQALDLLAQDLSSALFRDDGKVWFVATVAADAPGQAAQGVSVRFFTFGRGSNAGLDTFSVPIAVSYRVVRRSEAPSGPWPAYSFLRGEMRPGPNASLPELLGESAPFESGASETVVAGDVVDFGVRCYVRDRTQVDGLRLIFPTVGAKALRATSEARALEAAGRGEDGALFPHVVDLTLRVLTDDGAQRLTAFEKARPGAAASGSSTRDTETWWQIATASSQVFTRRVAIHAQAR